MSKTRNTVADMRAMKGKRQFCSLYVDNIDEARAAAAAGVDMLDVAETLWSPEWREAAGSCFVQVSLLDGVRATYEDYIRAAHQAIQHGGDCVYTSASTEIIRRLAAEGIPVVSHLGLIPRKCTWTGGFVAVGKTADSAMWVYEHAKELEEAGAFAAELEVVPDRVAAEISKRTSLVLVSMGSGPGADGQFLFAEDVLGYTRGYRPRHAKVYGDFQAEYDRLQNERIAAFKEYAADVGSGAYPQPEHIVQIADDELAAFMKRLPS